MSARGAYGYRLPTLAQYPGATEVDAAALPIMVKLEPLSQAHMPRPHGAEDPSDGHFMGMAIDLSERQARLVVPEDSAPEDVLHPLMAPVVARFARHDGLVVFHAGALSHAGGALIVAGARGAGKSTAMAACALRGVDILADDLAVVRGDVVFAGPRFLDLRPGSAAHLPKGTPTTPSRNGARARLELAVGRAAVQLKGVVVLAWRDDLDHPTATPVAPQNRLHTILPHVDFEDPLRQAPAVLRMVQVPTWSVERPRSWATQRACVDLLLRLAEGGSS